jgi:hypothetical protein
LISDGSLFLTLPTRALMLAGIDADVGRDLIRSRAAEGRSRA